jgi:hypothetical protein
MIKKFWNHWIKFGEILGDIVFTIIISIFYYTIFLLPNIYFTYITDRVGKKYNSNTTYFTNSTDTNIHSIDEMRDF